MVHPSRGSGSSCAWSHARLVPPRFLRAYRCVCVGFLPGLYMGWSFPQLNVRPCCVMAGIVAYLVGTGPARAELSGSVHYAGNCLNYVHGLPIICPESSFMWQQCVPRKHLQKHAIYPFAAIQMAIMCSTLLHGCQTHPLLCYCAHTQLAGRACRPVKCSHCRPRGTSHTGHICSEHKNLPPLWSKAPPTQAPALQTAAPRVQATNAEAVADSYFQFGGSFFDFCAHTSPMFARAARLHYTY